jgi:hypothetical protein
MNYMQNQDITKFEFLLTLENNIVIQRFFNVKDYNPESRHSLLLYNCVKDICNDIQHGLKIKSMEHVYEDQKIFFDIDDEINEDINEVIIEPPQNFLLEIKLGDEILMQRIFPAHIYHPKARYTVDIRPKVRTILGDLTYVLSSKEQITEYLNYKL